MLAHNRLETCSENKELTQLRGISMTTFRSFVADKGDEFYKLEYVNGKVYAMAGGSEAHNRLAGEIFRVLANHLGKKNPCMAFTSDQETVKDLERATTDKKNAKGIIAYPDAAVHCRSADGELNPLILVEVLSDSTGDKDRTEKLPAYKLIPTVQEILFIDQHKPVIELYARKGDVFTYTIFKGGESFKLASIGLDISVDDIYEGILSAF